ncbi:hypothetical protein OESDEN_04115 [Oesophagostomum dentatum]|uniref:CWH43-like N-terminal domain-containing protein n=1 Tax=Oesophagostomum dentatum TaxID=61180 RepID=A0A0B1TKJ0_OESDE|nr:hypothetical protein OESDEN_04115 [Oesophagostomum dentatum]
MDTLVFPNPVVFEHAWVFPVAAVGCLLIGMFSGYIIGVGTDHYPAVLPFISDGGANKPEASIFAQFLNLAAFFYVITLYIRHLQVVAYYGDHLQWDRTRWWYASFCLMLEGFASAFGLTLVANFRVSLKKRNYKNTRKYNGNEHSCASRKTTSFKCISSEP